MNSNRVCRLPLLSPIMVSLRALPTPHPIPSSDTRTLLYAMYVPGLLAFHLLYVPIQLQVCLGFFFFSLVGLSPHDYYRSRIRNQDGHWGYWWCSWVEIMVWIEYSTHFNFIAVQVLLACFGCLPFPFVLSLALFKLLSFPFIYIYRLSHITYPPGEARRFLYLSFVAAFVCLFVCLFVDLFYHSGWGYKNHFYTNMNTKRPL